MLNASERKEKFDVCGGLQEAVLSAFSEVLAYQKRHLNVLHAQLACYENQNTLRAESLQPCCTLKESEPKGVSALQSQLAEDRDYIMQDAQEE